MALASEVLPRTFGRYTLLEHLGEGGMAEVLLARQEGIEGTQRLVALKRILPGLARDEDFVEMFLDEVRIVSRLHHPNIGHILDVGRIDGCHYLAMEYIQGRDLAQICRCMESSNEGFPLELAVETGRQICAALQHAHTKATKSGRPLNIVHRDITPDNIIVTFDGTIKIVDFGIAMAENRVSSTRAGLLKGKPPYMAPEQVLGLPVDGRADLFALGVVLYRLITDTHPYAASGPERIFKRIIEDTPETPHELNEDCPRSLSDAVMRALEKDPDDRFADANAFSDALDQVSIELGKLPTPRSTSQWMARLFPRAVASKDRALADPEDNLAFIDASYLSVSADLHQADMDDDDDGIVSDISTGPGLEEIFSVSRDKASKRHSSSSAPRDSRLDDDEDDPDAQTKVHTEVFDEEGLPDPHPNAKKLDRALAWAFDDEDGPEEGNTDPEVTLPVDKEPSDDAKPADTGFEVWSPRQHWDHLPPSLRSLPIVSTAAISILAVLFFALLGIRSCL